ncbi:MAG: hypothetical protein M5U12_31740 [Verrucomicrobia bacterium]|nr:hypothetical protein [Verrucomicrobiota bacterium]
MRNERLLDDGRGFAGDSDKADLVDVREGLDAGAGAGAVVDALKGDVGGWRAVAAALEVLPGAVGGGRVGEGDGGTGQVLDGDEGRAGVDDAGEIELGGRRVEAEPVEHLELVDAFVFVQVADGQFELGQADGVAEAKGVDRGPAEGEVVAGDAGHGEVLPLGAVIQLDQGARIEGAGGANADRGPADANRHADEGERIAGAVGMREGGIDGELRVAAADGRDFDLLLEAAATDANAVAVGWRVDLELGAEGRRHADLVRARADGGQQADRAARREVVGHAAGPTDDIARGDAGEHAGLHGGAALKGNEIPDLQPVACIETDTGRADGGDRRRPR